MAILWIVFICAIIFAIAGKMKNTKKGNTQFAVCAIAALLVGLKVFHVI